MKKIIAGLAVAALPFVFASCGGDNSGSGTLQSGQISAVLSAVGNSVSQANQSKASRFQSHGETDSTTYPVSLTGNCTGGGTASLTGTLTGSTAGTEPDTTTDIGYSYTLIFNQCVSTGDDGNTYTLSGTGITVSGTSVWQNSGTFQNLDVLMTDNFAINGNVDVSGGESLSCDITLTQNSTSTEANGIFSETGSYTGTVCGQPENGTISIQGSVKSS